MWCVRLPVRWLRKGVRMSGVVVRVRWHQRRIVAIRVVRRDTGGFVRQRSLVGVRWRVTVWIVLRFVNVHAFSRFGLETGRSHWIRIVLLVGTAQRRRGRHGRRGQSSQWARGQSGCGVRRGLRISAFRLGGGGFRLVPFHQRRHQPGLSIEPESYSRYETALHRSIASPEAR